MTRNKSLTAKSCQEPGACRTSLSFATISLVENQSSKQPTPNVWIEHDSPAGPAPTYSTETVFPLFCHNVGSETFRNHKKRSPHGDLSWFNLRSLPFKISQRSQRGVSAFCPVAKLPEEAMTEPQSNGSSKSRSRETQIGNSHWPWPESFCLVVVYPPRPEKWWSSSIGMMTETQLVNGKIKLMATSYHQPGFMGPDWLPPKFPHWLAAGRIKMCQASHLRDIQSHLSL